MTCFSRLASAALTVFLAITPMQAMAQLSAKQVWETWRGISATFDQNISAGNAVTRGNTLHLEDVRITSEAEGFRMEIRIPNIDLTEQPDGSVAVTASPAFPMELDFNPDGRSLNRSVWLVEGVMDILVSGTPEAIRYSDSAEEIRMSIQSMHVEGEERDISLVLTLSGYETTALLQLHDSMAIDATGSLQRLALNLSGSDPADGFDLRFDMVLADLETSVRLAGIELLETHQNTPSEAFAQGARFDIALHHGAGGYGFELSDRGAVTVSHMQFESGGFEARMDDGAMHFALHAGPMRVGMEGADMPFPVGYALDDFHLSFDMPMLASTTPVPFGVLARVSGLRFPEPMWDALDPQARLSRDPAALELDIGGTGRWNYQIMDMDAPPLGIEPGVLSSLALNRLRLSLLGAELQGIGGLQMDEAAGTPAQGRIELSLTGANRVLDALQELEIIAADEAMFARMMLVMMARPTGEDSYSSTIAVDDSGNVTVNGLPLPF